MMLWDLVTKYASRNSGITLPYTFDPSALSDGALPSVWDAPTWVINAGAAINVPEFGVELLTDGSLEVGPYPSGQCASLPLKGGAPTLAEENADVYDGGRAQKFTPTANNDYLAFPNVSPTAHKWYNFVCRGKRVTGANGRVSAILNQTGGVPAAQNASRSYFDATYQTRRIAKRANSTNVITPAILYQTGATGFDAVLADGASFKQVSNIGNGLINAGIADHIVKVKMIWEPGTASGVIAKASADGASYLVAYYLTNSNGGYAYAHLDQVINGVWSPLIATWTNTPGAGGGGEPTSSQWLAISCAGNQVSLYQNDIQVGTTQTMNAALVDNTYVGLFDEGGISRVASFFVGES